MGAGRPGPCSAERWWWPGAPRQGEYPDSAYASKEEPIGLANKLELDMREERSGDLLQTLWPEQLEAGN